MKIQAKQAAFAAALAAVQGVTSHKSTLAILSNVLLEASGDQVVLRATNLDVTIATACPCEVIEAGAAALDARRLLALVKNSKAASVDLSTEANHFGRIATGKARTLLPGADPGMLSIRKVDAAGLFPIGTARLLDMIEKTLFSASTDEGRPSLNGAFFRVSADGTFAMISTDGHRLSRIALAPTSSSAATSWPAELGRGVIIPTKGLVELKRNLDPSEPDTLFGLQDNDVIFRHGPTSLSIRLIDGTFPDVDSVLPREGDVKAIIRRADLIHALKYVGVVAPPKTGNVRITLKPGICELHTQEADAGDCTFEVEAQYEGKAVQAGYNFHYLLDVLGVIDGDEITMEIIDTISPTMIRDTSRDDLLFVVMPMRV